MKNKGNDIADDLAYKFFGNDMADGTILRCKTAARSPLSNSKFAAGKRMVLRSLLVKRK